MKKRKEQLTEWLSHFFDPDSISQMQVMCHDASKRVYYRLIDRHNVSYVVMDAPMVTEKPDVFFRVARLLKYFGLPVPECYHYQQELGFIVLSDFGDQLLLAILNDHNRPQYYKMALSVMRQLLSVEPTLVPDYELSKFVSEQQLLVEWYLPYAGYQASACELNQLQLLFNYLAEVCNQQPKVFVHRDYHSRNILITQSNGLGIIDFQDAVRGPITYDLVSLLKDCYISWPREHVIELVRDHFDALQKSGHCREIDISEFIFWFDMTGLQRHIKCLGIFARLFVRDQRDDYLKEMPRVLRYIQEVFDLYPEALGCYRTALVDQVFEL